MLRTNSKTKATQHLHNLVSKPSRSTLECERRVGNDLGNVTALSNALAELILAVQSPHLGRPFAPIPEYHERFARQYRYEPPSELPLTSPFTGIVFHLSGPSRRAHIQTS